MSGALKLEFAPFAAPAKGVLVVFCEDGAEIRAAARKAARADRRSGRARRGGRPLQGQERLRARHRGAARARGRRGWSWSGPARPRDLKAQDFVKLGGTAMGQVPAAASEVTIFADLPGGGDEAGSGRRSRARRAAARLCLRPLQDQAQGGRGEAGADSRSRSRSPASPAAREGIRAARGGGRAAW